MNKLLLFSLSVLYAWLNIFTGNTGRGKSVAATLSDIAAYKQQNAIRCAAFTEAYGGTADISIPILQGWGDHRMQVSTKNDSAFLYFNQGINMFYGFHFIEARASFKKAQWFDSSLAMAYLGEVLTYSPNINNSAYKIRPYTTGVLDKAGHFAKDASAVEKAIIDAQVVRYTADTSAGYDKVNEAYVAAMKKVYDQFPANADAAAIYADALMQLHPWDLYDNVGNPRSWTAAIEGEISRLIEKFPDHPGLVHYYIHCVEASNTAYRGLESARKLPKLTPGLSHMLHMSSHIYVRTGFYADGVAANTDARNAYARYKAIFPDVQKYHSLYYTHNLAMEFANAVSLPGYRSASTIAWLKRSPFMQQLKEGGMLSTDDQYNYSYPFLAWIRYGKWDSILRDKDVPAQWMYASFLQHFAKGMALVRKHRVTEAEKELEAMPVAIDDPSMQEHSQFSNAPATGAKVAIKILQGMIDEAKGNMPAAIAVLESAVKEEDAMVYNEPKDWLLPARHYLGEVLYRSGKYAKAGEVYKEDLRLNPKNIWGLTGVLNVAIAEHNVTAIDAVKKEIKHIAVKPDVAVPGSRF